jgi:hypothetical protein
VDPVKFIDQLEQNARPETVHLPRELLTTQAS